MKVEFTGQSTRDSDNWQANPSRLVNCYREVVPAGGKTNYVIKSVPGLTEFAALTGVFVRVLAEIGGEAYACCDNKLTKIMPDGSVSTLGAVVDSEEASIAGNNGDITLCTGTNYYLWDGASLTQPTPGAFSEFGSLDYVGGYTVLTEKDGNRFQWSDLADASSLPGLNFSSADGRDDLNIRCMGLGGQLYIFKEKSIEVWYLTGSAGAAAFSRIAGGVLDRGLKAFNLISKVPGGGAFYVGSDNRAHIIGLDAPVSIPAVETAIVELNPVYCLTYEDEGHTFCAIVFENAPAWVYDVASGEWHERAQGAGLDPWAASVAAKIWGKWYVGRDGGGVYELGRTNQDGGIPLCREMVSRPIWADGKRFTMSDLEIFARTGFANGTIELSTSRDNGHTWTAPKPKSWAVGDYNNRVIWRRLGQFRQAVVKLRITDPIECPINAEGSVNVVA
jgi:hypothetical protein